MTVGTRILAVEDDERIRTAVKLALEDEGWTVEEAEQRRGGARALRAPARRRRADRHHAARHRRLRACAGRSAAPATSRSSWSPPAPTPTTWWPGSRPAPTTTSPSRSPPRSCRPASGPCCAGPARSDPAHAHLRFGDLEIIPDEGVVRRGGAEVHLTKTEFRLLVELASQPGPGVQPRGPARAGLGLRLLRRRAPGRRPRPPPAHQGRGRPRQPPPRRHRPGARLQAPGLTARAALAVPRVPVPALAGSRPAGHDRRSPARRLPCPHARWPFALGALTLSILLDRRRARALDGAAPTRGQRRATVVRQRQRRAARHAPAADPDRHVLSSVAADAHRRPTRCCYFDGEWYRPARPSSARTACRPSSAAGCRRRARPARMRYDRRRRAPAGRRRAPARGVDAAYFEIVSLDELRARRSSRSASRCSAPSLLTTVAGAVARLVGVPAGRCARWPTSAHGRRRHRRRPARHPARGQRRPRPRHAGRLVQRHGRRAPGAHRARRPLRLRRQPRAALAAHDAGRVDRGAAERSADEHARAGRGRPSTCWWPTSSRFQQLVEDLLEISRFDAGAMRLDLEEVRLAEFVHPRRAASTGRRDVTVERRRRPGGRGGRGRQAPAWRGCIANLLDNAAKYGGGATRRSMPLRAHRRRRCASPSRTTARACPPRTASGSSTASAAARPRRTGAARRGCRPRPGAGGGARPPPRRAGVGGGPRRRPARAPASSSSSPRRPRETPSVTRGRPGRCPARCVRRARRNEPRAISQEQQADRISPTTPARGRPRRPRCT